MHRLYRRLFLTIPLFLSCTLSTAEDGSKKKVVRDPAKRALREKQVREQQEMHHGEVAELREHVARLQSEKEKLFQELVVVRKEKDRTITELKRKNEDSHAGIVALRNRLIEVDQGGVKRKTISREQIEDVLDAPCPELNFPGETPLSEIINQFDRQFEFAFDSELRFQVDVKELDLEGITSLEDLTVRDVMIPQGSHTCRDALKLIFEQTTEPMLAFMPRAGHIFITTLAKAESDDMLETRVYDVSDLFPKGVLQSATSRNRVVGEQDSTRAQPATDQPKKNSPPRKTNRGNVHSSDQPKAGDNVLKQYGAPPQTTSCPQRKPAMAAQLIEIIENVTWPTARWIHADGEGGSISGYGQYLIVNQTYRAHKQIESLLTELQEAIVISGPPRIQKQNENHNNRPRSHGNGTGLF